MQLFRSEAGQTQSDLRTLGSGKTECAGSRETERSEHLRASVLADGMNCVEGENFQIRRPRNSYFQHFVPSQTTIDLQTQVRRQ